MLVPLPCRRLAAPLFARTSWLSAAQRQIAGVLERRGDGGRLLGHAGHKKSPLFPLEHQDSLQSSSVCKVSCTPLLVWMDLRRAGPKGCFAPIQLVKLEATLGGRHRTCKSKSCTCNAYREHKGLNMGDHSDLSACWSASLSR